MAGRRTPPSDDNIPLFPMQATEDGTVKPVLPPAVAPATRSGDWEPDPGPQVFGHPPDDPAMIAYQQGRRLRLAREAAHHRLEQAMLQLAEGDQNQAAQLLIARRALYKAYSEEGRPGEDLFDWWAGVAADVGVWPPGGTQGG